jgi:hypothetical protein
MNEAVKLWVEALRSGEYQQGRHFLNDGDGHYCCLGVLCELYRKHVDPDFPVCSSDGAIEYGEEGVDAELPEMIRGWAGLRTSVGEYDHRSGRVEALASQNDSGEPFCKIADIIEHQPPGLFA